MVEGKWMGKEGWNDSDDDPKEGVGVKLWDRRMSTLPAAPGMGWSGGKWSSSSS